MGVTALDCRVSTKDQNLDRQAQQTWDYATERLGVEPSDIEVYKDKSMQTEPPSLKYVIRVDDEV